MEYAHRMWASPIILTPFLWPAYIMDSPDVMAWMCIPLSVFNVVLLLNVMPIWRRAAILSDIEDEDTIIEENNELAEERNNRIAAEIEQKCRDEKIPRYIRPGQLRQIPEYDDLYDRSKHRMNDRPSGAQHRLLVLRSKIHFYQQSNQVPVLHCFPEM